MFVTTVPFFVYATTWAFSFFPFSAIISKASSCLSFKSLLPFFIASFNWSISPSNCSVFSISFSFLCLSTAFLNSSSMLFLSTTFSPPNTFSVKINSLSIASTRLFSFLNFSISFNIFCLFSFSSFLMLFSLFLSFVQLYQYALVLAFIISLFS